ncbi:MAG: PH domain-containing protein [Nitrososphaeraceae archaeon]|nr:PH domain-containing protein [Nitrososphaeraceae archaeon]
MNHDNDFKGELYDSKEFSDKELEQVNKIRHRLDKGEQVQFIARQSKHRPGGSFTTPDTIFVTNKRIVIRDPSLLGARENIVSVSYDKITSIELERGVFSSKIIIRAPGFADEMEAISKKAAEQIVQYVKNSMDKTKIESQKESLEGKESIADELLKLANLKEKGVLSDEEFLKMKKDLLNK